MSAPSVQLNDVCFAWPDGTPVLRHVTTAFGPGRTGLIGTNGSGKSTLLRLILGDLRPSSGSVAVAGTVGYLPQQLTLRTDDTVAHLLGVDRVLAALRAVEGGSVDAAHYETVGEDWDLESRAEALLARAGLAGLNLDRPVGAMSGGEAVLAAIAGLRLRATPVVLLDEPTNNLDRDHRSRLYDLVADWPGALLVVSHDIELLDRMDDTAELRDGDITVYGGGYRAWRAWMEAQQEAAARDLRTAQQQLRTEQRQRAEAETKLARRQRYGQHDFENKRRPKIIMKLRAREAQVAAGKLRGQADEKVAAAQREVADAERALRADAAIRIDLPDPDVASRRRIVTVHDGADQWLVTGPQRVALTGPNGAGKTRLLATLDPTASVVAQAEGRPWLTPHTDRIGVLAQRLDGLDDGRSLLDEVVDVAPERPVGELRAALARFLFRGDTVDRHVGSLSGGERFRVALARLLLADPPPQLLVLDEPTNNLDLDSVESLVTALAGYRGALLVVSHDDEFLGRLGLTQHFVMGRSGHVREV